MIIPGTRAGPAGRAVVTRVREATGSRFPAGWAPLAVVCERRRAGQVNEATRQVQSGQVTARPVFGLR